MSLYDFISGDSLWPTKGPRESPVDLSVPIHKITKSLSSETPFDKYLYTKSENRDKAKGELEST